MFFRKPQLFSSSGLLLVFRKNAFENFLEFFYRSGTGHIIKVILSKPNLNIHDILTHPFFMDIGAMVGFEDRMRTYASAPAHHHYINPHLNAEQRIVFTEEHWTARLEDEVREACINVNTTTFVGLWMSQRNRRHHRDTD